MARTDNTPALPVDRRGFVGAMAALGLAGTRQLQAARAPEALACIWINLVGGPAQLDTFDPKPDASAAVRGPFASIPTALPGVRLSELFPRLACRLNQITLLRALHHHNLPTHEAGWQELQTGAFDHSETARPSLGAHLARRGFQGQPGWRILPGPLETDGLCLRDDGQSPGHFGPSNAARPGRSHSKDLADVFLQATRAVETGTRFVTVNTAPTVFHRRTWDCHADGGSLPTTAAQTRELGHELDGALDQLLGHLAQTGLLQTTLVVATGEMGRTPHLNSRGGRDHWSRAWPALLAGAGCTPGAVVGKTDPLGGEPVEGALQAADLHRLVAIKLGIL